LTKPLFLLRSPSLLMNNPYPKLVDAKDVPWWRRILARLGIDTILYWDRENFKAPTPIFVAWCGRHNVFYLDYPHGYDGRLICPLCLKEWEETMDKLVSGGGRPEHDN